MIGDPLGHAHAIASDLIRGFFRSTCAIEATHPDGTRTTLAIDVACQVILPQARRGAAYPDDMRACSIAFLPDQDPPPTGALVTVDGEDVWRVLHVPKLRPTDVRRLVACEEYRGR